MIHSLQYISQGGTPEEHLTHIETACRAGVGWVQLRMKKQPVGLVTKTAQRAREVCTRFGARLIINDHPAVALAVGADGVHLGKDDMPVPEARELVGHTMIIGGTANTYEDIVEHVKAGVDYVGLGPYRYTPTKEKLSPILGLKGYQILLEKLAVEGISTPIVGIGGIELNDIEALLRTGLHGIAVSGLITHAVQPADLVKIIEKYLKQKSPC